MGAPAPLPPPAGDGPDLLSTIGYFTQKKKALFKCVSANGG